jgi:uncharacterized membrane protein
MDMLYATHFVLMLGFWLLIVGLITALFTPLATSNVVSNCDGDCCKPKPTSAPSNK